MEYLQEEYVDNIRSASSITKEVDWSITYVLKKIRDFGFEVRSKRFYYDNRSTIPSRQKYRHILTREFLEEEYVKKKRSAGNIGKELGIYHVVICDYIRRYGIPMRDKYFHHQGERNPNWGKPLSDETKEKLSRANKGKRAWSLGLTKENNATLARISQNLKGRKRPDITLEKHPNWQGGKSFEPYGMDFTEELRNHIRERDNHACRMCNETDLDYKLHVHHVDYDKENNTECNLVSLCKPCHTKTNFNREVWTTYFKKLLKSEGLYLEVK